MLVLCYNDFQILELGKALYVSLGEKSNEVGYEGMSKWFSDGEWTDRKIRCVSAEVNDFSKEKEFLNPLEGFGF